jgi:hypothetical protein
MLASSNRAMAFALLVSAWPAAALAQVKRGGEFQVNVYTTGGQIHAAVAADASGRFFVVWGDYVQEGDVGVFGRRYDAAGNALGGELHVNTYTASYQRFPAVSSDPSGNVIVVWQSPQDAGTLGVYALRYDAAGNPSGGEFRVNAATTGNQQYPQVAVAGDGSFMVVWQDDRDGSFAGIAARRYNAQGIPGPDLRVNTHTTGNQIVPTVAADAAGNFVVVWSASGSLDGSDYGVFGRRYDSSGAPAGGEFQVNSYVTSAQSFPAVAMAADGRFMVAWQSSYQDGDEAIAARRFDADGTPLGPDAVVNTFTTGSQYGAGVAADSRGDFVVTWRTLGEDGDAAGVFARRYYRDGAPDPEFQVNTYTTGSQFSGTGAIAAAADGDFVVVWTSGNQDGDSVGSFGQRFSPDLIFRDGFESGTLGAWSASATDGGNLSPSAFSALRFSSIGLQGVVNDTSPLYVEDDTPADEDRYRARFYFDPNDFDPGESQGHLRTRIFIAFEEAPTRRLAAVVLKRQGGNYGLMLRCRLDSGAQADTGFVPISNGPHAVEIDWRRSSGASANDGQCRLYSDDSLVGAMSNLDNSVSAVDFARLGALSVKTGASGTLFWDEFESRREGYVGP